MANIHSRAFLFECFRFESVSCDRLFSSSDDELDEDFCSDVEATASEPERDLEDDGVHFHIEFRAPVQIPLTFSAMNVSMFLTVAVFEVHAPAVESKRRTMTTMHVASVCAHDWIDVEVAVKF